MLEKVIFYLGLHLFHLHTERSQELLELTYPLLSGQWMSVISIWQFGGKKVIYTAWDIRAISINHLTPDFARIQSLNSILLK